MTTKQDQKMAAARRAVELIEPGMHIGVGSGSTVDCVVDALQARLAATPFPLTITAASAHAANHVRAAGLPYVTFDETPALDLLIDGADEVDRRGRLIKGGGGALVREKILAFAARTIVIAVDSSKPVDVLGALPLPVAVVPFGWQAAAAAIGVRATQITLRRTAAGDIFVTDDGLYILDCECGAITDPIELDVWLHLIPAVVETGLFIECVDWLVVGRDDGTTDVRAVPRHAHMNG